MNIFRFLKVFKSTKKEKREAELAQLCNRLDESIALNRRVDELSKELSLQKEKMTLLIEDTIDLNKRMIEMAVANPSGNASLERVNGIFLKILENFEVIKKVAEELDPKVHDHAEILDILLAQYQALSSMVVRVVESLIDNDVLTKEDVSPVLN